MPFLSSFFHFDKSFCSLSLRLGSLNDVIPATFILACKSTSFCWYALITSSTLENILPSPNTPFFSFVMKQLPKTISCPGTVIGLPDEGDNMFFVVIINIFASSCASIDIGTCTAIWSPSKSALNAVHVKGCNCIDLPSTNIGSKA